MNEKPKSGLLRRLRGKGGYSIAEALLAVLIVALLSSGIAAGVSFAVRQYNAAMVRSESMVLTSTLTSIIRNELSIIRGGSTVTVVTDGEKKQQLDTFFSKNYSSENNDDDYNRSRFVVATKDAVTINDKTYGYLAIQPKDGGTENLLVGRSSYSAYQLKARVDVTVNPTAEGNVESYDVTLSVLLPSGELLTNDFTVLPLNTVGIASA